MDESGFLIMHNHFVAFETVSDLKTLAKNIGKTHITQLEKSVAEDMIKRKYLYRKECKDFKDITNDNFYEVNVSVNIQITKVCPKYQIAPLKGTTAYLGRFGYFLFLNSFYQIMYCKVRLIELAKILKTIPLYESNSSNRETDIIIGITRDCSVINI
jgi:hypothetical protein